MTSERLGRVSAEASVLALPLGESLSCLNLYSLKPSSPVHSTPSVKLSLIVYSDDYAWPAA